MTIAEQLDRKPVDQIKVPDETSYDAMTGIFTFKDGSKAKMLTIFEKVEPFITASLSTSTDKHVKKWMAI